MKDKVSSQTVLTRTVDLGYFRAALTQCLKIEFTLAQSPCWILKKSRNWLIFLSDKIRDCGYGIRNKKQLAFARQKKRPQCWLSIRASWSMCIKYCTELLEFINLSFFSRRGVEPKNRKKPYPTKGVNKQQLHSTLAVLYHHLLELNLGLIGKRQLLSPLRYLVSLTPSLLK